MWSVSQDNIAGTGGDVVPHMGCVPCLTEKFRMCIVCGPRHDKHALGMAGYTRPLVPCLRPRFRGHNKATTNSVAVRLTFRSLGFPASGLFAVALRCRS